MMGKRVSLTFDLDDISLKDIEETRALIEVYCAKTAAENIKNGEQNVLPNFPDTTPEGDFDMSCNKYFELHAAIGESTHNRMISQIVNTVNLILSTVFVSSTYPVDAKEEAYEEHKILHDIISTGDKEKAAGEMLRHILMTNKRIVEGEASGKNTCK